jgi:uncharacterized repeat protein (TIGR02543 family)
MKVTFYKMVTLIVAAGLVLALGACSNPLNSTDDGGGGGGDPATYSVTYDKNGADSGTVPTDDTAYEEGAEVTVKSQSDLSKSGYSFAGWNTKADGSGTAHQPDDTFSMPASDVTLYVQWVDADAPSGYSVSIDQSAINSSNETAISFTFSGAETGTTYNYLFTDGNSNVAGSDTVSSSSETVTGIDVSSLNDDDHLTLQFSLTDEADNKGDPEFDTIVKDTVVPSGYTASIDQTEITTSNENDFSFTFSGAETGAAYKYSISDSIGDTLSGDGSVSSSDQTVSGIDVSGLNGGTLTLNVSLKDGAGNEGAEETATVSKYYAIGDTGPAGGIIFYDDDGNGHLPNDNRYLEAAPDSEKWKKEVWDSPPDIADVGDAINQEIGAGKFNTNAIVSNGNIFEFSAAVICSNFSVTNDGTTYSDWFLPSLNELKEMHNELVLSGKYWSSSQFSTDAATAYYYSEFGKGNMLKSEMNYIRAVRMF